MTDRTLLAALLLVAALPAAADGQRRPPPEVPFVVGAKVGFDTQTREAVVAGGFLRVPLPVPGRFALGVGGDLTFLEGLTERQLTVDVVYDLGGVYVGAGPVFRNTIWPATGADPGSLSDRESRTGFSLVLGLGGSPMGRLPLAVGLEYRFVWVDDFRPRPLTLGVGVALNRLF